MVQWMQCSLVFVQADFHLQQLQVQLPCRSAAFVDIVSCADGNGFGVSFGFE